MKINVCKRIKLARGGPCGRRMLDPPSQLLPRRRWAVWHRLPRSVPRPLGGRTATAPSVPSSSCLLPSHPGESKERKASMKHPRIDSHLSHGGSGCGRGNDVPLVDLPPTTGADLVADLDSPKGEEEEENMTDESHMSKTNNPFASLKK